MSWEGIWVGRWYARLHIPHIILNSLQPLRGLGHSVIIFRNAQSHISTWYVCSLLLVFWGEHCFSEPTVPRRFVIVFLEYWLGAPICRLEDVAGCYPCCRCRRCCGSSYPELYEEYEVEHINMVLASVFQLEQLIGSYNGKYDIIRVFFLMSLPFQWNFTLVVLYKQLISAISSAFYQRA